MKIVLDNIIFSLQKIGGISILWGELIDKMKKDNISFLEYEKIILSKTIFIKY
jgi:mannosyltransferase